MKNEINAVLENMTATTPEPEDYTGEDGLPYIREGGEGITAHIAARPLRQYSNPASPV